VTQACLLVLDDLGVERQDSMFGPERVRFVIRARHMDGLPTIVTSNMGPKEIKAKLDERMGSRLGSGFRVHLTGRDRRG
jgi:DNA replication protein DnaC